MGTAAQARATLLQPHVLNTLEFSCVENLFGPDGNKKGGVELAPGDHLVGIISVSRIVAGGQTVFTSGPTSQLTGIYAHKVLAVPPYLIEGGVSYDPYYLTAAAAHIEFGSPDPMSFTDGSSTFSLAPILAPGEMLALWLDQGSTATPYTTAGSMADDLGRATDGSLFLSAGLGATGYFYGHADPSVTLVDLLGDALIGKAFSGLEIMINATGLNLGSIPNLDDLDKGISAPMAITCDLDIPTNPSPWVFAGTDTARIQPVPEPSTFSLFGAAGTVMALWRLSRRP